VGMDDIPELARQFLQFAANNLPVVADADKQTAPLEFAKALIVLKRSILLGSFSLNSRVSDSPPLIRFSRFYSVDSSSTPALKGATES
jgi:hypothetical protein